MLKVEKVDEDQLVLPESLVIAIINELNLISQAQDIFGLPEGAAALLRRIHEALDADPETCPNCGDEMVYTREGSWCRYCNGSFV